MAETMTDSFENTVNQAATTWIETVRDAGKAVAESAIAIQDRSIKFAQTLAEQGFRQVEEQTAALRGLYATAASKAEARQETLRTFARDATAAYTGLLTTCAQLYRRAFDSVRDAGK